MKKLDIDEKKLINLYLSGMDANSVAEKFNTYFQMVYKILAKYNIPKRKPTLRHGFSRGTHAQRKTYQAFQDMKQRCYNKNNEYYDYYGGRGIKVCERWLEEKGFMNFLEDMGEAPEGLTLDRKKNDLDYFAKNCRWVNQSTQLSNRRPFNKAGAKGVILRGTSYQAGITLNGKRIYLGSFKTLEEASAAFNKKHKEIYGD